MESHLLQMRGLKRASHRDTYPIGAVASFTDAWIETIVQISPSADIRRIFYRCVD